MRSIDIFPWLLLLLISSAVSCGTAMVIFVLRSRKHLSRMSRPRPTIKLAPSAALVQENQLASFLNRPSSWLAVKSRNLAPVQAALGLHHVKPCSWIAGLNGEEKLFVAPPVRGWVLVFGSA